MAGALPTCAVIIPTFRGGALTAACLDAVLSEEPTRYERRIVVVDDGSGDDTATVLGRFAADITFVALETNQGFARACNAGAAAAGEVDHLVFLNNDTLPTHGWLDAMVEVVATDETVAAVGAKLLFPDGHVQHAGVVIGQDGWPHHLYAGFLASHPAVSHPRDVPAVTAACMLIRRADFDRMDGFDPAFHNGYEDVDFCLKLGEAGRRIVFCDRSVVYHLESVTRWPTGVPEAIDGPMAEYLARWGTKVVPDDVRHYLEDGLLTFGYGSHYPLSVNADPEFGVVTRDGAALTEVDALMARRSEQVMELLSRETRRQLRSQAHERTPSFAPPLKPAAVTRLHGGREHALGEGPAERLISVLLPVKDGGAQLAQLLPALLAQSLACRLEIVAVDSGSRDDSVARLAAAGATVLGIAPEDFDHGLTRNLAAEHARGEILVFLSQSARPIGSGWLSALVAALEHDHEVAGACSRVLPYPDADLLTRRDGERELSASPTRERKQITDWADYRAMSAHDRRVFLNFHTVSAAIRAERWADLPFRSVRTLGEDLLWARDVIEAGWALVHEPASCVHHSHDYTLEQRFARNVDDGIANREIVGRGFDRAAVVPQIAAMARDDWSYLREQAGLTGSELEQWQLEAVLRRTAQTVGQWLGANADELATGSAEQFSSMPRARASASDAAGPRT